MTGRLTSAFAGIRAEDGLKSGTMQFLYRELQRRGGARRHTAARKYALALACAAVVLLSGAFARHMYGTPAAYVDVDVNPSIELTLNRFNRVIDTHAYNEDGAAVIRGVSVKHKRYGDALALLMDEIAGQGYLRDGGLVSVTLQTEGSAREERLLSDIQTGMETYMTDHRCTARLDVFSVSGEVRGSSHERGVSPAKYLAIQELIAVDPTASVETCRGHSISEIKRLTREHGGRHGGGWGAGGTAPDGAGGTAPDGAGGTAPDGADGIADPEPEGTPAAGPAHGGGHHGKNASAHGGG